MFYRIRIWIVRITIFIFPKAQARFTGNTIAAFHEITVRPDRPGPCQHQHHLVHLTCRVSVTRGHARFFLSLVVRSEPSRKLLCFWKWPHVNLLGIGCRNNFANKKENGRPSLSHGILAIALVSLVSTSLLIYFESTRLGVTRNLEDYLCQVFRRARLRVTI